MQKRLLDYLRGKRYRKNKLFFETLETRCLLTTEGESLTIERSIDSSGLSGVVSGTANWGDGSQSAVTVVSSPSTGPLRVRLDYSLDSSGFFAEPSRRDILQSAVDMLISKFADNLAAITPSGSNRWNASFQHPSTGQMHQLTNLSIASNELVVFVGARPLTGSTLALASVGGYSASGTQGFLDIVRGRGQVGALAANPTDFGPWGGAIAFQSTAAWHFGKTTSGLEANEHDFLSAALHEFAHLLGFGTAASWSRHVSNGQFTGPNSKAKFGTGGNVPLDSAGVHWAHGTAHGTSETLMDPSLAKGARKFSTRLDLAGMQDLGWSLIEPNATIRASHMFADNRNYDVIVNLSGSGLGSTGWTQTVAIANSNPVLQTVASQTATAGEAVSLARLGVFTDLGFDNASADPPSQEKFSYRIDWGDGSAVDTGTATIDKMGSSGVATSGYFSGLHTYSVPGNYVTRIAVYDDDGGTAERTFQVTVQPAPRLELAISKSSIRENGGAQAASLSIRRTGATTTAMTVNLQSGDTSEIRLPTSIVLPVGVSEAIVAVEAIDDSLLDGAIQVQLIASANGLVSETISVLVTDHETLSGVLNSKVVAEDKGKGALIWTITRSNSDKSLPLLVQLTSSDTSEIVLPATVTIPAGEASVEVLVDVQDDAELDGAIDVSLRAQASGYEDTNQIVGVLDVETLELLVTNFELSENKTNNQSSGKIRLSFLAPSSGYEVSLNASVANQLLIPERIVVPAGAKEATFEFSVADDYAVEGTMGLRLMAGGRGVTSSAVDLILSDDDEPWWQNPVRRHDTDNNGTINSMDALIIINNLMGYGNRYLVPGKDSPPLPFLDTNGDGAVTSTDALAVINELNRLAGM